MLPGKVDISPIEGIMAKVESHDLMTVALNVLTSLGVHGYRDVEITSAFREGNTWKVNFSYTTESGWVRHQACFAVNSTTGEITSMWKNRAWT